MTATPELAPEPATALPGPVGGPCPACAATGSVDPTPEQMAAYQLLPGTRLRCGACAGTGATGAVTAA